MDISNQFKTHTSAMSYFLQSILSIVIGILIMRDDAYFLARASTITLMYFGIVMCINFIQILTSVRRGYREIGESIFCFCGAATLVVVLVTTKKTVLALIPIVMLFWILLLALSSFISFMQYRKEKSFIAWRYFLLALIHVGFAIPFLLERYDSLSTSFNVIGGYLILLGVMSFLDGLSIVFPNRTKNFNQSRFRITLPTLIAAFIPIALLNRVNKYFAEDVDTSVPLRVEKSDIQANVEVFVHVSPGLRIGHVDLSFDDKITSYGSYDKESIKYKGIVGSGVMYEVKNKSVYTKFCNNDNNEILFGFGLALSEEELEKLRTYYECLKANASPWKCKAQRARDNHEDVSRFQEYPCRLSQATDTTFYKFHSGSYKYYWVLGTNCVKFIDDLLRSSGMKTILAGIITPGTYYTFLNNEFLKGNSIVVSRTVYCAAKKM